MHGKKMFIYDHWEEAKENLNSSIRFDISHIIQSIESTDQASGLKEAVQFMDECEETGNFFRGTFYFQKDYLRG